jgi:hypothetical protein
MVALQSKSLSSIQPITFNYFDNSLDLSTKKIYATEDSIAFYSIEGLANYQDSVFNRYSCLSLTSAVSLSTIFTTNKQINTPVNIVTFLQANDNSYLCYDLASNTVLLSSVPSYFLFTPVNTTQYQIVADGYYLQIDTAAPYIVRGTTIPIKDNSSLFTITLTPSSDLTIKSVYLSNNVITYQDNILQATTNLNSASSLSAITFSDNNKTGYIPNNLWVSYYMNFTLKDVSKDLTVNNVFNDVKINYLIDFPYEEAVQTGVANVNISNLKTKYTPQGHPLTFNNFVPITTLHELFFLGQQISYNGELIYFEL